VILTAITISKSLRIRYRISPKSIYKRRSCSRFEHFPLANPLALHISPFIRSVRNDRQPVLVSRMLIMKSSQHWHMCRISIMILVNSCSRETIAAERLFLPPGTLPIVGARKACMSIFPFALILSWSSAITKAPNQQECFHLVAYKLSWIPESCQDNCLHNDP
jgi:hypothetical protein